MLKPTKNEKFAVDLNHRELSDRNRHVSLNSGSSLRTSGPKTNNIRTTTVQQVKSRQDFQKEFDREEDKENVVSGNRDQPSSEGKSGMTLILSRLQPGQTPEFRFSQYETFLTLSKDRLEDIFREILHELQLGCRHHWRSIQEGPIPRDDCALQMIDSFVDKLPSGRENGVSYALDWNNTCVKAIRAQIRGDGIIKTSTHEVNLRHANVPYPKGLMDRACDATALFDFLAAAVKTLMDKYGDDKKDGRSFPVGFSMAFPLEHTGAKSASLLFWTKGFETGRQTDDPVEGLDVATLLDLAFWRLNVPAHVVSVANDGVSSLIAAAYETPAHIPQCAIFMVLGVGYNGAYVEPNASKYGYQGRIINTEIGAFRKTLPITDVDRELAADDVSCSDAHFSEKMVGGGYLGEIIRRTVLRLWQSAVPSLAFVNRALPTAAAMVAVTDTSPKLIWTKRLLDALWDWDTTLTDRVLFQKVCGLVIGRAAAVAGTGVAALARRTGRLTSEAGGVTVAMDDASHVTNPWYQSKLRRTCQLLLGDEKVRQLNFLCVAEGTMKGAAIMAHLAQ